MAEIVGMEDGIEPGRGDIRVRARAERDGQPSEAILEGSSLSGSDKGGGSMDGDEKGN